MKTLTFLILLVVTLSGCKKPVCNTPPLALVLRIHDANNIDLLSPQVLNKFSDSVALYYNNGQSGLDTLKTYISQHTDADNKTSYQLNSPTIGYISSAGTKTFYLRRSHTLIDTIYADYAYNHPSACQSIGLNTIKFNGLLLNEFNDKTGYYFQAIGKDPVK